MVSHLKKEESIVHEDLLLDDNGTEREYMVKYYKQKIDKLRET